MSFFADLMSPLNKDHCMYFYFLGYLALLFAIVSLVIGLISIYKKNYKVLGFAISYFFTLILAYYVYRLNYSVCLIANK